MTDTSSQQITKNVSVPDPDFKMGMVMNLIDEDTQIEIRDLNGDKIYIHEVAVIVTTPDPTLLITIAPF